ncbi:MAG: ankyrin repeat domain-containing protein, partial [Sphingopyxis sp.]|nr:ankyrin repeat domain-containing protein [Sphingopyxis sp.]
MDIHKPNTLNHGKTLLMVACYRENLEAVKLLLQKGVDVNKANEFQTTPFGL